METFAPDTAATAHQASPLRDAVRRFINEVGVEAAAPRLADQGVALWAAHVLRDQAAPTVIRSLRDAAAPYIVLGMQIDTLAANAQQALSDAGIPHVVLKGPALARRW